LLRTTRSALRIRGTLVARLDLGQNRLRYRGGMNYKLFANVAKKMVDKRGGTEALKQDLDKLQKIAKGEGSVSTKAGKAAEALKNPGPRRTEPPAAPADTSTTPKGSAPPH